LETFYSPSHFSSSTGLGTGEEGDSERETFGAAAAAKEKKEERVIIEGLSENITNSNHTIHMWEITRAQRT
jgi:hypothetical protein